MKPAKKIALIILDGWAHGPDPSRSAIAQANTPFTDSLYSRYPNAELVTWGEAVGLPEGQMGNSEVGHLNIGAGRVVYQELLRINKAIENGTLKTNQVLNDTFEYAKTHNKSLHLMGLVSDGGVHSHINHLLALCDYAVEAGLDKIFIHAFTDGRDTDPKSGTGFIQTVLDHIDGSPVRLASIVGRYYAMDRDKRWERIKIAYDCLVHGKGQKARDAIAAMEDSYAAGVTDEFLKPIVLIREDDEPVATIQPEDAVICFNFRTDRCRQITIALTQHDFPEYEMYRLPLFYTTMTRYDDTFENIHVIFENENLNNTVGEVISKYGLKQIRIAETEKYPHVTFFFSGGREEPFPGEKRILIPSPKVPTYDLQPEMSAVPVTRRIIEELQQEWADFICLNYANPDMVGHTGVFSAAVKAVETVDQCLKEVVETGLKHGYSFIITSDHGNADYMINDDGSPNTAHTKNPVPIFLVMPDADRYKLHGGKLADIAPTILKLMGIEIPEEMTGEILIDASACEVV